LKYRETLIFAMLRSIPFNDEKRVNKEANDWEQEGEIINSPFEIPAETRTRSTLFIYLPQSSSE
jgi:archaellum component FlaG (FlaF/FlaG flagellin family)